MHQDTLPRPKTAFARRRRAEASRIERDLWHQLRAKRLDGWKFKREVPIGSYVVDFMCFSAKLVVEADGSLHENAEQLAADRRRQAWLEKAGYRVLRFSEDAILSDLAKVVETIRSALQQTSPSPGRLRRPPSPSRGEGHAKAAPAAEKVLVIACGALAREIGAIVEVNGLGHIDLTCLPAQLHNFPQKIPEAVRDAIRMARAAGYERIAIGYADCGTGGLLDKVCDEEGVARIEGPHCYAFYWGNDAFAARTEDDIDAFFLTDFLARQFESFVIEPLGLDRHPELRDMYFGNYRRLIFLAQTEDPALEAKARAAAERLGLAFEMRRTGVGDLTGFLGSLGETPVGRKHA